MKRSISSNAFCSITDRQTDKIFTEQMLIYEGNVHKKKLERYLNQGPRKSRFTLNMVDIRTDGHLLLQSSFATKNITIFYGLNSVVYWLRQIFEGKDLYATFFLFEMEKRFKRVIFWRKLFLEWLNYNPLLTQH